MNGEMWKRRMFIIYKLLFSKYFWDDKIQGYGMSGLCNTHEKIKTHTKFLIKN
jgi:hypothetical protein